MQALPVTNNVLKSLLGRFAYFKCSRIQGFKRSRF